MNRDQFRALCSNPASTVADISRAVFPVNGFYRELDSIPDDSKFVQVVRGITMHESHLFDMRSLAFYLKYKHALFPAWEPDIGTLFSALLPGYRVDAARKVEYMLQRKKTLGFRTARDYHWRRIAGNGLCHRDTAIRCQFPAHSSIVAAFLAPLPPRVQCRVLEDVWMSSPHHF